MAVALFGLAFYLMSLARWGKSLKEKNAPQGRRHLYGALAGAVPLIPPFFYGGYWPLFVWGAICGSLGYATVAYAPQWIVGKPTTPVPPIPK